MPGNASVCPRVATEIATKRSLACPLCRASSSIPRDTLLNSLNGEPKVASATVFEDGLQGAPGHASHARVGAMSLNFARSYSLCAMKRQAHPQSCSRFCSKQLRRPGATRRYVHARAL